MKHTKENWKVYTDKVQISIGDMLYSPNRDYFEVDKYLEVQANAKLIAAAPMLLSSLMHVKYCMETKQEMGEMTLNDIKAAIQIATL